MKTSKSAASSRREKRTVKSEADIRAYSKSSRFKADAARSKARGPDPTAADLKAIPALTGKELASLSRAVKKPVTVRVDADIVQWLKSKGGHYQKHLNATLRDAMLAEKEAK